MTILLIRKTFIRWSNFLIIDVHSLFFGGALFGTEQHCCSLVQLLFHEVKLAHKIAEIFRCSCFSFRPVSVFGVVDYIVGARWSSHLIGIMPVLGDPFGVWLFGTLILSVCFNIRQFFGLFRSAFTFGSLRFRLFGQPASRRSAEIRFYLVDMNRERPSGFSALELNIYRRRRADNEEGSVVLNAPICPASWRIFGG